MTPQSVRFNRTLDLELANCVASISGSVPSDQIREKIKTVVAPNGGRLTSNQQRVMSLLRSLWVCPQLVPDPMLVRAQDLFREYPQFGAPLHYGLALVEFPFFREIVVVIGRWQSVRQPIRLEDVQVKIQAKRGQTGTVADGVRRVLQTLCSWKIVERTGSVYQVPHPSAALAPEIQAWLGWCALVAHPNAELHDVFRLPELFPFLFTIDDADLVRSTPVQAQRQGNGLTMLYLCE